MFTTDGQAFFSAPEVNFHQSVLLLGLRARFSLRTLEQIIYVFIRRQQQRRNFAVWTGPMEQDFLLFVRQIVWDIGPVYIVVYATGWITEEKALK